MAGKTFHGVGDLESESPPLGSDGAAPSPEVTPIGEDGSGQAYSGPTIVDEAKIAESLKRLRSLDQPPPPSVGVSMAVVDAGSAEPTRIDARPLTGDPMPLDAPVPLGAPLSPFGRPTALGHSVGPSVISQQVPQLDPLRGTMFGHSIHLPDVNTPEAAPDELSSGALMVLPRPTAEEIQPFLPDRTTRPAQQLPQVPIQAPVVSVQPLKRAELFHEPEPSRTDVLSGVRHRVRGRTAFVVITVAAAAGVVFAWLYSGDGAYGPPPPPRPIRVPGRTALSPTAVTPPSATATAPTPPVEVPEIVVPAPPPPARAAAVAPEPSLPAPTPEKPRRRERRSATAAPDRNAIPLIDAAGEARPVEAAPVEAKAPAPVEPKNPAEPKAIAEPKPTAEPKGEVKPGKVGKRKKAELEDDPDATLPPSD